MNKVQKLWPTLKRLLAYGSPYRKPLGLAVLMLWIAAAAEVAGPILVSYFIDNYVAKGQLPLMIVGGLAAAYILLELLAAALHYFQALLFNQAAVGVVQRLRTDVMDAALRQPLSAFDTQPVGQLISRVTNDTEVIKDLYVMVVSTVLKSAALIGAMLVAMFSLDWRMALVAICIFPAVFVVMGIYQYYSTPIVRRVRSYLADINDGFNEVINGMGVIQQFRQQVRFGERMSAASQSHYLARMQTLRLDGFLLRPLLSLFSALVLCGLLMLFGFSGEGVIGERRLGAWAADAFDTAAAAADQGAIAVVEAVIEHRVFRIDHRQPGVVPLIADVAPQRGGGAAGAGAHYDVFRHREGFARHLAEDAVGDVVVAAPVGGALGVGELIHIVAVQLFRQQFGGGVDLGGVIDEVTAAAVKGDLFHLAARGAGRHHRDERQADQASEVGFGHRGAAGRGLDDGGVLGDPAVAQAVKEQRARQAVFQAAGRVGALIFQVQADARKRRQVQANQVRIGGALKIRFYFTDSIFYPRVCHDLASE